MIRVLIADSDSVCRERLRAALAEDSELEIVGLARDGQEALQWAHARRPDVALLAADLAVRDGFQTAEILAATALSTLSVLLLARDDVHEMRRAMRSGARECLLRSCLPAEMREVIHAVYAEEQRRGTAAFQAETDPRGGTRLFAVSGAKGGIGKTTLAVNLAVSLARETGEPTLLLDLYTQFGDAAALLNISPRRALSDLASLSLMDVDEQILDDYGERHSSGLQFLCGSLTPQPFDTLTPALWERVLGLLKRRYRFLVVDVPPFLDPSTLHVLSAATAVLLVANLYDLTTMQDTRLWLNAVAGNYVAPDAVQVVLNRVSRRNRLQVPDVERALGRSISFQIPNDGKIVPASVNAGVPFVLSHPGSPAARSIRSLACALTEQGMGQR